MAWPVPLPGATGDEAADLAAFLAWEQAIERHYHPDRFGPDGERLPVPREFTYYLGVPEPSWLGHSDGVPKFVSAARFNRYVTDGDRWPVKSASTYAIDSGAYIALTGRNKQVPWFDDPDVYGGKILRFIDNTGYPPDFVACQDFPCEPAAQRATGLTVRDHQDLTTDSYIWLAREFPMVEWIPVLQGERPGDHLDHYKMYLDRGVDLAACRRVGVGSICRLTELDGLVERIAQLEELADAGLKLHGFGIKTDALPLIGHVLASADSMAWSAHVRHNGHRAPIRLPGCTHAGDCRNCYRYAVHWRERVLATLTPKEATVPTTTPHRTEMRFPAELRADDVFTVGDSSPLTFVSSTVKPSQPKFARITVKECGDVIELDAFDKTPAIRMISRGSVDPIFSGSARGTEHLYVPLTHDPGRCGECGDSNTPNHITPPAPVQPVATPAAVQGDLFAGLLELTSMIADKAAKPAKKPARKRTTPAKTATTPRRKMAEPQRTEAEFTRRLDRLLNPAVEAKPLGTVKVVDVADGVFAEATGMLPTGEEATLVGYVINVFTVVRNYQGWTKQDCCAVTLSYEPEHLDGVTIEMRPDDEVTVLQGGKPGPDGERIPWTKPSLEELLAEAGLTLTGDDEAGPGTVTWRNRHLMRGERQTRTEEGVRVLLLSRAGGPIGNWRWILNQTIVDKAVADEVWPGPVESGPVPLHRVREDAVGSIVGMVDGREQTVYGQMRGFWSESAGAQCADTVKVTMKVATGPEVMDWRMVTVQVPWTGTTFYLGDATPTPDPEPVKDDVPASLFDLLELATAIADKAEAATAGGPVDITTLPWGTHDKGVDLFRPRDGEQYGIIGGYVGAAGDGLDDVRKTLAAAEIEYGGLRLPRDLEHGLWKQIHAVLRGMGATGGARKNESYTLKADRVPDLGAFIAGGPAPKHERATAGWVRTPDALAADVVARFVDKAQLPAVVRALEPSAGDGALVGALGEHLGVANVAMTVVEPDRERVRLLGMVPVSSSLYVCTFEEYVELRRRGDCDEQLFDLVVMNPPYSTPGNRGLWELHVKMAWELLAEGGQLVAILPGDLGRTDLRRDRVLTLVGPDVRAEQLPKGSFKQRGKGGTDIDTWVLAATKPVCPGKPA